jgi:hypothetical protein
MALRCHTAWTPLAGQWVQIRNHGIPVDEGFVEMVTNDDQILWLSAEGLRSRRIIARSDGCEAWIDYKWETSTVKDESGLPVPGA